MGAPIHPAVRERARVLYEEEGYSPEQIVEALSFERLGRSLNVPGQDPLKVAVPNERTTINNWAKKYGWKSWREAKKKVDARINQDLAEGVPFAISGINDPIWHLSVLEAQQTVRHCLREVPTLMDSTVRHAALVEVHGTLKPGPRVLERLRPLITEYIKQYRQKMLEEPAPIEEVLKSGKVFHSAEESEDHWIASLEPGNS
jgi:hypothetical protein